ncbi:MAG: hypothetical protein ABIR53_04770 [Paraperlucidibaca sp.]
MSAWSTANQPLQMDIELAGLSVAYASEVQVRVASEEDHARLGLTRPSWADSVRFQMITLPNYRVVARASTANAIADDPVSFVVEIRTPGEGRLQQVGSALGLQPIASKNPPPERVVKTESATKAPSATPVSMTKPSAAPAKTTAKPAVNKPVAKAAVAPATTAAIEPQDRAALEQGLRAAKAQVADIEARIAALDAAATKPVPAAASTAPAAAPASDASVESAVASMVADDAMLSSETSEAMPIVVDVSAETGADNENAHEFAAATAVNDDAVAAVNATPLKPYQLFARLMILVVGLILLVFFLIDKIRNRR